MYKNYIKVARRNLLKHRSYTLINVLGLSVGLACFMFIWMFVGNELSYDKSFSHNQQIYRVCVKGNIAGSSLNQAVTGAPLAVKLRTEVPGVITATQIARFGEWLVRYNGKKFNESGVIFADSCFFDVFDYPFLKGSAIHALSKPNSVVLSKRAAERYFGEENPVGKMLRIESDSTYYQVTGVVETPQNSHIHFDFVAALSTLNLHNQNIWVSHMYYTYVMLEKDYKVKALQSSLDKLVIKYVIPQVTNDLQISLNQLAKSNNSYSFFVQALTSIHLNSNLQVELEPNGNSLYISIFTIVSVLILLIACINFMNLATARSSSRAKEVVMRKVLGSSRNQLIIQFLLESVFLSLIAFGIALVIVELLTPAYALVVQKNLSLKTISSPGNIIFLTSVVIMAGILSGSYPAFVIASFKPVNVLKGNLKSTIVSTGLRNYLVIAQFTVSVLIMIFTCTVYRQLQYMQHRDLGFDKSRTLVIKRSDGLKSRLAAYMQEIEKLPGVLAVGNSTHIPGKTYWYNSFFKPNDPGTPIMLYHSLVSTDYAEALGIKMKMGRFFSKEYATDSLAAVINESAIKTLGFSNPIGMEILIPVGKNNRQKLTIIGVMNNFNFKSLHYKIEPMIMTLMHNNLEGYIVVRVNSNDIPGTIHKIQQKWDFFTVDYPFEYFWMDEDFSKLYVTEKRIASIFFSFSIFSIFIACLGLFGLIAFIAGMRMKEIGIRKSMGASFEEIILMLTKDTFRLIGIALLIAWPISFFVIQWWLKDFSYRIPINFQDFIWIALGSALLSFATISYQAIKAAGTNPTNALKYE